MTSTTLKWIAAALAAALVQGLTAFMTWVGLHPIPGLDPLIGTLVAALVIKGVGWVISKVPAAPSPNAPPPPPTGRSH